jgi:hypothetical protein
MLGQGGLKILPSALCSLTYSINQHMPTKKTGLEMLLVMQALGAGSFTRNIELTPRNHPIGLDTESHLPAVKVSVR